MRSTWTWVVALAVALVAADAASAQEGKQRRRGQGQGQGQGQGRGFGGMMGGGGGLAMLLGNEGVQKELKLSEEQTAKVKEFAEAQGEKMREAFGGGRPDFEKMREMQKASTEAAEKLVKETLKPEQQKRLKQIQLQQGGLMAFASEEVQKGLSLTDEQKEKLKTLGSDMQKDMQELRQGGFSPETMQKTRALTKEYMGKAADMLTDDQKAKWKEMTGEPFEVQMQRRRPGGDR
jgi:Spy/CpxP family protein refolding chaperone